MRGKAMKAMKVKAMKTKAKVMKAVPAMNPMKAIAISF